MDHYEFIGKVQYKKNIYILEDDIHRTEEIYMVVYFHIGIFFVWD